MTSARWRPPPRLEEGRLWIAFGPTGGIYRVPPESVAPDGSLGVKIGWQRGPGLRGRVSVEARRLDERAPPVRRRISAQGYGLTGFQASGIAFPTQGCWRVTASADQGMAATDVPFRYGNHLNNWGYLHVIHEHGWDEDRDRTDTQAALLDPAPAPDQPGSHQFYFFYLGPNKIPCTRRVVARFNTIQGEPGKRGIITSFAHPGWYRRSDFP